MKYSIKSLLLPLSFVALAAMSMSAASPLSSGRWVKMAVDTTGIYRIDYQTIKLWGFDNPEKVAIYGYGSVETSMQLADAPLELPAVAVKHHGGALYFYAESDLRVQPETASTLSTVRNMYSYGSHYFLTDDLPAAEPATSDYTSSLQSPISTHTAIKYYEPEEYNPSDGGAFWYSNNIRPGDTHTVDFDLTGYTSDAYMGYKAIGKLEGALFLPEITASDNVAFNPVSTYRIPSSNDAKEVYHYMSSPNTAPFSVTSGSKVSFNVARPDNDNIELMCLDAMWVMYSRENIVPDLSPELDMHFISKRNQEVELSTSGRDVEVWDVTDVRNIRRLALASGSDGRVKFSLPSTSAKYNKVVAFNLESDKYPTPRYEGEIANTNLQALKDVDMIIVAPAELIPAAERLAQAHKKHQGLEIAIIDKADIFNEFGSGAFAPNAIRRMAKSVYNNGGGRLRYLLLFGGAFYDNRSVASDDNMYLPSYQVEGVANARNIAKAFTADAFYGMFDEDLMADISSRADVNKPQTISVAVGRIPVLTVGEAEAMVDKCIRYLENPSLAGDFAQAIFMADRGNANQHMIGAESSAKLVSQAHPEITIHRGYQAAFQCDSKVNDVNTPLYNYIMRVFPTGISYLAYAGHGDDTSIFSDAYFNMSFLSKLNYSSMPVMFIASCHPFTLDYLKPGIFGSMLLDKKSGPIAVYAPAREVYLSSNQKFSDVFSEEIVTADRGATIGDVAKKALNIMLASSLQERTNALSYNVGGDPAIPVRTCHYSVESDVDNIMFNPGEPTTITGKIVDSEGNLITSFNGRLTMTVYDRPLSFLSYVNVTADNEDRQQLMLDDTMVSSTSCLVKDGRWSATITVPAINNTGVNNRVSFSAMMDDSFESAIGMDYATISEDVKSIDTTAPEIELSIDGMDAPGDVIEITDGDPVLNIKVRDDMSGISFSDVQVGCKLMVMLDEKNLISNVAPTLQPDGEGGYSCSLTLGSLLTGRHTIRASVGDNAGNIASASVELIKVTKAFDCTVAMDDDLVTDKASFSLTHSLYEIPSARFIIEDLAGNLVYTSTVNDDYLSWDLKDINGNPVDDGTYNVYAIVKLHPRYSSTPKVSFTIIR
ncbi:MAG: type IX secretion system sortase PorU [Lachnoclostridium sp.]|nr:type IX secretion system sortase PorU [Lachnoclostridium sp.]